ncbi:MAG: T9SS type A sorting domain-containing protein [Candidatus Marinimicrobia bacterium]|nr:T9SS type A sorting domain-containing protein [Candidatus Neomarinimicrobiota bacterium]
MRLFKILIGISILTSTYAQEFEDTTLPCKPLSEMAGHYDRLAKAAQRADVWDFDVHYYDIKIKVNADTEIIHGNVEVHLTSTIANLETIQLDFTSELTVDSIFLNGATYNHFSNILSISLDGSYDYGEDIAIGISYHGHPLITGFQAFKFGYQGNNNSRPRMISTLSEPYGARSWWPCKDVPTDKADSVRISITADTAYTAVANGLLISETSNLNGTKTSVWEHKYPITTYLVFLSITDYNSWTEIHHFADGDSMPLEYWMYPDDATPTNISRWNLTSNMINIFSEFYGKYPFSQEKYGMAQFGWGGAMEHQTCSSMGSSAENTIAHELAHQWWGDLVTCSNFHHIWLNEGFATYSEALYWGAKNGESAYHAHMALKMNNASGSIFRPDTSSVGAIFSTSLVYSKAAWVLHMLRHTVGDETFFESLLAYRDSYQFRHASTEDFQTVVETVSGQDLEWFFDQWIYGGGKPDYHWWWNASEPDVFGKSQIVVHIDQIQESEFPTFKMPIDLNFSSDIHDTTVVVWDSLRIQDFTFQLDFEPTTLAFDEPAWIFKSAAQISGVDDRGLQPGDFFLLEAYPNPFNGEINIPYVLADHFEGQIKLFDLKGTEVYSQNISHKQPGYYELKWQAVNSQGLGLSSGIYIAQIQSTDGLAISQKITLLK